MAGGIPVIAEAALCGALIAFAITGLVRRRPGEADASATAHIHGDVIALPREAKATGGGSTSAGGRGRVGGRPSHTHSHPFAPGMAVE